MNKWYGLLLFAVMLCFGSVVLRKEVGIPANWYFFIMVFCRLYSSGQLDSASVCGVLNTRSQ